MHIITKNNTPPATAPKRESPGKYGKSKKTKGFKKSELGFKITYKIRDEVKETANATKDMLKTTSNVTSFLIKTKSSRVKTKSAKRKIKKQSKITRINKCIIFYAKTKKKILTMIIITPTPVTTVPTPIISASPPARTTGKNDTTPVKAFNNP